MHQLGTVSWSEGITLYAREHLRLTNTESSRELVLGLLAKVGTFTGGLEPEAVTRSRIRQFLAWELESGLSAWTVNAHLVKLRSFFKWLCVEGAIQENPADGIPRVRQETTAKRCAREADILLAIGHLGRRVDRRLHDLVILAANMGMRLSEMLALEDDPDVLDFAGSRVLVARSKTREPRPVPMNDAARTVLESRRGHGLLFRTSRGTRYTRENALRDLQSALSEIGLGRMTFHGLRHWWITRMYNLYPPELVRVIAGNSPDTARRHYIHSDQFTLPSPPVIR